MQRPLLMNMPLDFRTRRDDECAVYYTRPALVLYMAPSPALAVMNVWIPIIRPCRLAHVSNVAPDVAATAIFGVRGVDI